LAEITRKWSDAGSRLLTITIGAPTVFFIMYLGGLAYSLLVLAVSLLCAVELHRMIFGKTLPVIPVIFAVFAILFAMFDGLHLFAMLMIVLLIALLIAGLVARRQEAQWETYQRLAGVTVGAIYVCLPIAVLLDIRDMPNGLGWTYLLFVNNWATDAFALIGGRIFGKTKMAPTISSGKTWEGAVIGYVLGTCGGMIVAFLFGLPLGSALFINLVIAFLTIIGDLVESIFKRYYGIKDTGSLLPGHGGFLDRVDGLVLAIIPLYALLLF